MTCSRRMSPTARSTRFSYGELAPIIDFDRTPAYRSSAWILPLLYCSLAILLPHLVAVADAAAGAAQVQGRASASNGRSCWAYRSSRIAAIAILAVLIGWVVTIQMLFSDLGNEASFNAILLILELLSIVVFIGGFAVMLWYAWTAWRSKWRWPGKVWSILLVIASGTIAYIGLVFKLIGFATNY